MKAICMKSGLWALALLGLWLALPLAASAEPALLDCQPAAAQALTLLDMAPELGQNVSPVVPPETQPAPLKMSCSGDDCGCYEPSCIEECGAGNWPCINPCRRAQIQCAIACCAI